MKETQSESHPDTARQCQQEPVEAFTRKQALVTRLIFLLVMSMGVVFWILVMIERDVIVGLAMTFGWVVVFGTTGLGALHNSADIIISPQGISRQFFGKNWKSIAWNDVARLGITEVIIMGKKRRMVSVHRMDYSKSKAKRGYEFAFDADDFKKRERLVEVMNCYIKKYNISIERKITSKKIEHYEEL